MAKHISKAKALLSIVLVLCLVAVMLPTGIFAVFADDGEATGLTPWNGDVDTNFGGGDGSTPEKAIEISTGAQLAGLAQSNNNYVNKHIKLTADIDLAGKAWTPIGLSTSFQGKFNGDGHTIYNLSVTSTTTTGYFGLFGTITSGAVVENLTLKDAVVDVADTTGGLGGGGIAGRMYNNATVSNCHFDGTIKTSGTQTNTGNRYVGGLVGWYQTNSAGQNGRISGCSVTGTMDAAQKCRVGGFVGIAYNAQTNLTVEDCYSTMTMTNGSTSNQAAAMVSNISAGTTVVLKNCFFAGTIDRTYPFTYSTSDNLMIMSSVFVKEGWCTKTGTITPAGGGVDTMDARTKTAAELVDGTVTNILNNGRKVWMNWPGYDHPIFYQETPEFDINGDFSYDAQTATYTGCTSGDFTFTVINIKEGTAFSLTADTPDAVANDGDTYTVTPGLGKTVTLTIAVELNGFSAEYTVKVRDIRWDGVAESAKLEGSGSASDPYLIASGADLLCLSKSVLGGTTYQNKYIELTNDIDLNNMQWTPIGTSGKPFRGIFEGNGHTIKNVKHVYDVKTYTADPNTPDAVDTYIGAAPSNRGGYKGLFGYTGSGAQILNLNVAGLYICTDEIEVGGLIGYAFGTLTVRNCHVEGTVIGGSYNYANHCGGLIGYAVNSYDYLVEDSSFVGHVEGETTKLNYLASGTQKDVNATPENVGGILGGTGGGAHVTFKNCAVDATIIGQDGVGGIIGTGNASANNSGTQIKIYNCYSDGVLEMLSTNTRAGGLVGWIRGSTATAKVDLVAINCYSVMTATGKAGNSGGLLGGARSGNTASTATATFDNCYFAGSGAKHPFIAYINNGTTDTMTLTSAKNVYIKKGSYTVTTPNKADSYTEYEAAAFADGTLTDTLNANVKNLAAVEGVTFYKWANSTAGYPIVSALVENASQVMTPVGTSIRSKNTSQGIRFKFAISKEAQTAALKEVGIVLAQLTDSEGNIKAALADENLVMHNLQKGDEGYYKYVVAKAYEKGSSQSALVSVGDQDWFAAALVNFQTAEKLAKKYIARSYAIFTDAIGNEFIVYGEAIGDQNYSVSVYDVAERYYNDETLKAQLTDEELEYVQYLATSASWHIGADWNDDGVLKILTIGNSYSEDATNRAYKVAKAAGVQEVVVANMYISGCTLATHLKHAKSGEEKYTYWYTDNGTWTATGNDEGEPKFALVPVVASENWDFITFQQGSTSSGVASTYDDLDELMEIVKANCTNPNVKFAWHMTWAYASDYHIGEDGVYGTEDDGTGAAAFKKYNYDQMTMYNAIVDAVETKIMPRLDSDGQFFALIPNGTAIQNARTSYLGDTLNRDGTHLSNTGRFIAAVGLIETLIGIDWNKFDVDSLRISYPNEAAYFDIAFESLKNAIENPFEITQSAYTTAG